MRKKYLPFIAIAIMTFFVACSNEDLITEENTPEAEGAITITASMPDDEPQTRIVLTRDEKNINLTWQPNDWLQFAFVQNGTKRKKSIQLSSANILNNGKRVTFTINPPDGIVANQPYDLYGVYGLYSTNTEEGGISGANPTNVILTRNPGNRGTLELVQNRGDVMLYFKSSVTPGNPPTTVTFKHLGSLFAISFNNTVNPSPTSGVTGARLVGVDANGDELTNGNWAFNNGTGGQVFNLLTEQFQDITTAGNYISFSTAGTTWNVGQTTTLWAWYPPIPNQVWPALRLVMTNSSGDEVLSSDNFKPQRPTAPVAGKVYHFYARWNGTALNFTNDQFVVSPAN